mmetsp:Transcript_105092/g.279645  ORF Transcript_105092/g.279645 Transcript_105092/m.279645 type:complete len:237 (+) Transcript_105092:419-1129(+)
MHGRQGAGHGYARHVVGGAREGVDHDHVNQCRAVLQHGDGIRFVLHVSSVATRQAVEQRKGNTQHDQHAPEPLEANNLHPGKVDVGQQPLLRNDLCCLHHLAAQRQGNAKEQHALTTVASGIRAANGLLGHGLVAPDAGEAYEDNAHDTEEQAQKVVAEERPLEACHGKDGRKNHLGPAQQLPDAGRDVEEAHAAEARGQDVEDGGHAHHQDLLRPRGCASRGRRLELGTRRRVGH